MSTLQIGYAQVTINPSMGIGMRGYYKPRFAQGILDDLLASALAVTCKDSTVLLISIDNCGLDASHADQYRNAISVRTGIPAECILLNASHTHTGPFLRKSDHFEADYPPILRYAEQLESWLTDVSVLALADRRPGRMGFAVGYAPDRVAYIRRYKMRDGTTCTCPPVNCPDILQPIGTVDQRVNVLRFDRDGAESVILMNYGLHADTIGGERISSDWPGWMRRTVHKALDGVQCMFFGGCQGDVGSTNVNPSGGDMNDTQISFDNEMKSPGMARFIGRALAGTILQVYDKVAYVDVDRVAALRKMITLGANVPKPEDLPLAHEYKRLHDAGRDDLIPYTAMELSTVVAEALRMVRLENGPEQFQIELTGVAIGPIALLGIPGQPFTATGVAIKETKGWANILPCSQTNGDAGYFPTADAFAEGGYEARTSSYLPSVEKTIIDSCKEILSELRQS